MHHLGCLLTLLQLSCTLSTMSIGGGNDLNEGDGTFRGDKYICEFSFFDTSLLEPLLGIQRAKSSWRPCKNREDNPKVLHNAYT